MLKLNLSASWRTSATAAAGALIYIFGELQNLIDGDPATTVNLEGILKAVGVLVVAVGLLFARDNKVSDQEAGARPEPQKDAGAVTQAK